MMFASPSSPFFLLFVKYGKEKNHMYLYLVYEHNSIVQHKQDLS